MFVWCVYVGSRVLFQIICLLEWLIIYAKKKKETTNKSFNPKVLEMFNYCLTAQYKNLNIVAYFDILILISSTVPLNNNIHK